MGLDITAYRKLSVVENPVLDEEGYPENWREEWKPGLSLEWSEEEFPGRAPELDPDSVYRFEEEYDFRAGSYSGYGWWRDELEAFAEDEDFFELINFADNEGAIGTSVSKKLLNDFVSNYEHAKVFAKSLRDDGEWWIKQYETWMKAFELAADDGAVAFH